MCFFEIGKQLCRIHQISVEVSKGKLKLSQ